MKSPQLTDLMPCQVLLAGDDPRLAARVQQLLAVIYHADSNAANDGIKDSSAEPLPAFHLGIVATFEAAQALLQPCHHDVILLEETAWFDAFLAEARRRECPAPIIALLNSNSQSKAGRRAMQSGASDYLFVATIDADSLERALRSAFRYGVQGRRLYETQQALQRLEARGDALHEHSWDVVILIGHAGEVVYSSPSSERVLGYTPEELAGQEAATLVHTDDLPVLHEVIQQALQQPRTGFMGLTRVQHKDGSWRWVEKLITNLYDEPSVDALVCNLRDVTPRKQAEDALRESEELFREMADSIDEVFWLTDPETSRLLYLSPAYEKIWGRSCQSLYEQPLSFLEVMHPDDRALMIKALEQKKVTGSFDVQYRIILPDGTQRWIWSRAFPVRNDAGEVYRSVGVAHDITGRKQMEIALRESEERFRGMAENIDEVFWMVDPATHKMLYLSPAYEKVWGRSCESAYEKPFSILDTVHPDDRASLHAAMRDHELFNTFDREHRIVRPDGTVRWIWARAFPVLGENGKLHRVVGIAQDITERKQAEDSLREAHQELRRTYEELEARVKRRTQQLEKVNEALNVENIERRQAQNALHEAVLLLERTKIDAVEAHAEAEVAREEAERANLAKSEFLSRMSHELRTPLNSILGFAQLLELEASSDAELERVEYIMRGGQHLLKLINEVLDIARVEAGHLSLSPEPVHLDSLLRSTVDLIRPLCHQRGVRLVPQWDGCAGCHIKADQQRLAQVLLNLLSNATKYNLPQGEVRVKCELRRRSLDVAKKNELVDIVSDGNQQDETAIDETVSGQNLPKESTRIRISISDTGQGISAENLPRLFQPFDRLGAEAGTVEGTGLGLALSRGLVEAMGGTIGVDSTPGVGSTFWVELGMAESPLDSGEEDEATPDMPTFAREHTVLYIEDNLANLQLIEHLLSRHSNLRLLTAMQGQIGLDLAREHKPSLILLDMNLPDIQGDEVLRRLLADPTTADIPVVVISADATPHTIRHLMTSGATNYITKPIEVRSFLEIVHDLLYQKDE